MSKIAIITGGSRGIGATCARLLATQGYDIALTYLSNADKAEAVAQDVRAAGQRAVTLQADMAVEADILRMFETVDRELGPVTAMINNAGITGGFARIEDVESDVVRRVMDANVTGSILCCREAVKRMSTTHGGAGGVIVNLSSLAAFTGSPNDYVYYAASKAAVNVLTVGLAKEVAGDGIRVNAVAPGAADTDIHADGGQPDRPARLAKILPMKRIATPEEVAATVAFLLSDGASYISGAVVPVTGAA